LTWFAGLLLTVMRRVFEGGEGVTRAGRLDRSSDNPELALGLRPEGDVGEAAGDAIASIGIIGIIDSA
jgi:hypothetical protein